MLDLTNAIVYDIEVFPNCFTFSMEMLNSDTKAVWEISSFKDDKPQLLEFFSWLSQNQIPMIGFNNIHYDYPIVHMLWQNPNISYEHLYAKSMNIIDGKNRFDNIVWSSERFTPQIDVFKIHHFDNAAKSTGLKALEINMRSSVVLDMPVANGTILTEKEIRELLIPYNQLDVSETKKFTHYSTEAINFRNNLVNQFGVEVLNWNDTKIGEEMVIQQLPDNVCYDRSSGKRKIRQTPREILDFKDIIFPYIHFENKEFNRIKEYLENITLTSEPFSKNGKTIPQLKTKGAFSKLSAFVGGIEYFYGTGGIHASLSKRRIYSTKEWKIIDIDVGALYPSVAIANELAPEHLGHAFVEVYSKLPAKRREWQKLKGKKCVEANSVKLASNGVYGKSNSPYSLFYDPKFTMTVTINGQLLLSMLAEQLSVIPTLQVIQCNTDGITYYIHKNYIQQAADVCKKWETMSKLVLEEVEYEKMFIRDVNNYIAVGKNGSVKLKGAYWTPDPTNYFDSISKSQPPAWHKDLSNPVSVRAAVSHMIDGTDIELFIKTCTNPFDFIISVKTRKSDKLLWGEEEMQRNTRFYVSTTGKTMKKQLPPKGRLGTFKKANGVSDREYNRVMKETGGAWDERVCTKNKSVYSIGETSIIAGHNVTVCNDMRDFRFDNLNYDWYINEALKLIF